MRAIDEIFLQMFKDLSITEIETPTGLRYRCALGKDEISHKVVVKMVKDYQEAIIKSLLEGK